MDLKQESSKAGVQIRYEKTRAMTNRQKHELIVYNRIVEYVE